MALSPLQMQEAVIRNLPEKTGKTLDEWIGIARSFNLQSTSGIRKKLKSEYGLGHVQAQTVVWRMDGDKPYVDTDGYEERIFRTGRNFELYTKLKEKILALGGNITVKPCKTYIPFYSKNQFAMLTEKNGKLILGLCLEDADLLPARNIGGTNRITRMLVIDDGNISQAMKYINKAKECI